jgi:hypothetical protein
MECSISTAFTPALQEYWNMMYDAASAPDAQSRDVRLLRAWGVFQYIFSGPKNCERCHAPVRLAVPITSERLNGETLQYGCLCTNCAFKELEAAHRIIMQVGSARVEYPHEDSVSP